jgi:hypothetical protein
LTRWALKWEWGSNGAGAVADERAGYGPLKLGDDMAYNAADEKDVKDGEKKIALLREQELEDLKDVLSRPSGIRVFRRLFREGRIFHTTFTGNSNGFFLEGGRNLALKFFDDVAQVAPNKISDLIIEKTEDK